ncbi:hypothetical protein N0V85_008438 [Neurospora sp. IMI 360204]|nr:hypothetical protein N0V85_008438 [Neurospora sp. IMI 360204]
MSSDKNVVVGTGTMYFKNGDTTVRSTFIKIDGEIRLIIASTSGKEVTIPANFGRRSKTGESQEKEPTIDQPGTHRKKVYLKVAQDKDLKPYWVTRKDKDSQDMLERGTEEYGA